MTKEEIEALQAENRRLKQQAADRDARDAQVRQEQLHKDNVAFAEKLVAEGRLAPPRLLRGGCPAGCRRRWQQAGGVC